VSISSLQTNNWIPPYFPQSSQTNLAAPLSGGSAQTNASSPTQSNPFQQLAADVHAVLAQGQSATTTPAAGSTTTDPTQQLATDLQSIYAQLQATQAGGDPGTPASATGRANGTEPPHHHHHTADTISSSGSTSTSPTAASGNQPNVAQALTADMMRALKAYASSSSASSSIGLTI
jgi:hypothetical protein